MRIQTTLLSTDNIPAIVGEMTQHLMKFSFDRIGGLASVTIDMNDEEKYEAIKTKFRNAPAAKPATSKQGPVILPVDQGGDHRTGSLEGISVSEITKILGFNANVKDDPYKVKYSWGFTVDGVRCGVWDYKGSYRDKCYSTFGPADVLTKLFGDKYGA